ncbi:protein DYAD [Prosopis cineraria]|uniref:protein DYAD n=1 Tax=Prosopis cineraria TaxID=364024 RepID=UPI0024104FD7|nr:protein DYAD [Prosopis cineraria]
MKQLDDGAAKAMERLYMKKKEHGDVDGTHNPCLDKHILLSPLTSVPICTPGACEFLKVGRFYEIDHSNLPPNRPDHLKFVRVVMLSDMGGLQVSVRYPSMQSVRTQFYDANYGRQDKKKIPALDEKYVMESGFACSALYRRVSTEELAERGNSWSFWITTSEEDQTAKSTLFIDEETDLQVSKKGSCWSQLKYSGMVQWGKRRPVRFLAQHEKNNSESLSGSVKDTGLDAKEENERGEMTDRKRKKWEEKEFRKEVSNEIIRTTRKSKRNHNECSEVQRLKKAHHGRQNQLVVYNKKKHKVSIDRWSAERYKLAEENMLKVMKAKGAVFEKPILRPALRSEARKLIGDTGLLDHLLKHMAGKVAPGGTERFRRRHNAEGAMEYWLESADLVKIRQEAGVQDPYWTPPPGWKPGDNPSQDPICARELREIKKELSKLKHEMQQLVYKKREEQLAIMTTTNSCLSNNFNLERGGSLFTLQEMYKDLVNKKSKIEEQLKDISMALAKMEEQMMTLKSSEEPTSESVMLPALLPSPARVMVAVRDEGETKEQEGHKNNEKKAATGEAERSDDDIQRMAESGWQAAEDRAAKIERLKSGFRICQPQGTFIWPKIAIMSPQDVVPTPSSASSSSFPEPPPWSEPSSLVKPQAERRPISSATLTHVAMSFPPFLSPPPLATPPSQKIASHSPPLINLNEAPLNCDPPSCATLPYQSSLASMQPRNPVATEKKAGVKKEKEMENLSSSISERKGWWNTAMDGALP